MGTTSRHLLAPIKFCQDRRDRATLDFAGLSSYAFTTPYNCGIRDLGESPDATLDQLLEEAKIAHGYLCAGQALGVRLAMSWCARPGIEEPRGRDRKRCRHRVPVRQAPPEIRYWGKMAAKFVDLETCRALRTAARESSKDLARQLHPEIENKNLQQMAAYPELSDHDLSAGTMGCKESWLRRNSPDTKESV